MLEHETEARRQGFDTIAGVDEAGRGPLAGPVVAAAVILPRGLEIPRLTDSKKLPSRLRAELYGVIIEKAVSVSIHAADAEVIDSINILQATRLAMREAVSGLESAPDCVLIDGAQGIDWPGRQKTIVKGDSLSLSIAAASVVAKVTRDRLMEEYGRVYPEYGFERHKGYGSADHLKAIREHGPCPIHRRTFKGVREFLPPEEAIRAGLRQMTIPNLPRGRGA